MNVLTAFDDGLWRGLLLGLSVAALVLAALWFLRARK